MRRVLAAIAVLFITGPLLAQAPDPAAFVRDLYVRYAQVEPTRQMTDFWVRKLQSGTDPSEVHANILGSSQTFDRCKQNNETWVRMLYADVLGRPGEAEGIRHWLGRLKEHGNDRVKLSREFLTSAGAEIGAGAGNPIGGVQPEDLPALLLSTSQLVVQSVQAECSGSKSWVIREQAKVLNTAATVAGRVLSNPRSTAAQKLEAVVAVGNSNDSLRAALAQSPVRAPETRKHAEQLAQVASALADALGGRPVLPILPGNDGISVAESRNISALAGMTARDMSNALGVFKLTLKNDWAAALLFNNVEAIASEADALQSAVRPGTSGTEVATAVARFQQAAEPVTKHITRGGVDPRAVQAWYSATASLNKLADAAGKVGRPGLPGPGPGGVNVSPAAFRAIDQAIAESEGLAEAFGPYTFYSVSVTRLIGDLRDLRTRYAALRQSAAVGVTRRELQAQLEQIEGSMRSATTNWRAATRDPRLQRAPDLNDLAAADREVARLISAAR